MLQASRAFQTLSARLAEESAWSRLGLLKMSPGYCWAWAIGRARWTSGRWRKAGGMSLGRKTVVMKCGASSISASVSTFCPPTDSPFNCSPRTLTQEQRG